jgi:hypothetical protein
VKVIEGLNRLGGGLLDKADAPLGKSRSQPAVRLHKTGFPLAQNDDLRPGLEKISNILARADMTLPTPPVGNDRCSPDLDISGIPVAINTYPAKTIGCNHLVSPGQQLLWTTMWDNENNAKRVENNYSPHFLCYHNKDNISFIS